MKLIKWISPIIICYLVGILIANTSLLNPDEKLLGNMQGVSVGLAIPLLLFSANLKKWLGHASKTLLSFGISIVGVLLASTIAYFIFSNSVEDANKVSGMMIGVYTGGTPNMAAIGTAVNIDREVFLIINGADVLISGIYFIFLLTIAKPLLRRFLPAFKNSNGTDQANSGFSLNNLKGLALTKKIMYIIIGVVLATILFGVSFLLAGQIEQDSEKMAPWLFLFITTGAIGLSFIPRVRNLKGSYNTAEYFLLVFAVAIGCMADAQELIKEGPGIMLFCGFVVLTSITFHYVVAGLFRIDADTVIITSTAAIYGPAFVGPVANAIKNPNVIVSGITMGMLGYSFAYYLGKGIAGLLGLL